MFFETGADYSAGRPSGAALKAAGITFVIRYIDAPERLSTKHISVGEYADLRANGIRVFLVGERTIGDWSGGFAAGRSLVSDFRRGARFIGYSDLDPLFVTVDTPISLGQVPVAAEFVRGAVSVQGFSATGIYGFSNVIRSAVSDNWCAWRWQCGSISSLVDGAHFWQDNNFAGVVDGIEWDRNYRVAAVLPNGDEDVLSNVQCRPGVNQHECFGVAGTKNLRVHLGFGESVSVHQITWVDDTNNSVPGGTYGPSFVSDAAPWVFEADRPGPVSVPAGATQCSIRYDSTVQFHVSVSSV